MFLRLSCGIPPWLCTCTWSFAANHTWCGHAMWLDTTLVIYDRLTGRHSRTLAGSALDGFTKDIYKTAWTARGKGFVHASTYESGTASLAPTMAMQQNNKPLGIILSFKVLQFVRQLRRRVKPRVLDGSIAGHGLGIALTAKVRPLSRRLTLIGVRGAREESQRHPQRARRSRQRRGREPWRSAHKQLQTHTADSAAPANRNLAGDKVQQYVLSSFLFGFTY